MLGTRPEVVKLAPVVRALRARAPAVRVAFTSQHRELARGIGDVFDLRADFDLDIMTAAQQPHQVAARVQEGLQGVMAEVRPALVMVQGDTTTAMAAAMAAFYGKIPVAHVEAGLRTNDPYNPFPEEMNRRLITRLAVLHFAATHANRRALLAEGVADAAIHVTGNPVIDAVEWILADRGAELLEVARDVSRRGNRILLLTTHRRENFGAPQAAILRAVGSIVEMFPDVEVVFPVHPNPVVRAAVAEHLPVHPRIHRLGPLEYPAFINLLSASHLVLTDSGGLQEEAPALGKPTLVLRTTTEREEMIAAGSGLLVGIEQDAIVAAAAALLSDDAAYSAMATPRFPFGEGGASERIAAVVADWLRRTD